MFYLNSENSMEDALRGRFSQDIRYVESFLELFSLIKGVNLNDVLDQMLSNLMLSLSNIDSIRQFKQDLIKSDCLKLVLLSKFTLFKVEGKSETSGIERERCKCILRLCLSDASNTSSFLNFDTLEIALWLLNTEDFLHVVRDFIKLFKQCLDTYLALGTCTFENIEITTSCLLNLFETIINVFLKKCSTTNMFFELNELLNEQNLDGVLVELALHDNGMVSVNTLTRIFPIIADSRQLLLGELWRKLKKIWIGDNWEEVEYNKIYFVLSSVANLFFPLDPVEGVENFILVKENEFWEIILFGIGQKHSVIRKQSRFLLRKALDFATRNSASSYMHFSTGLFCWNDDKCNDLSKIWNDYFLILEALEEKQVHLIEPILITYENSLSSNLNLCISTAWNLPIYQRMFSHDSNFIVKYGLRLFLSQNLEKFASTNVNLVSFLLFPLLQTLNDTYLYVKQEDSKFQVEKGLKKVFSSILSLSQEFCHSFFSKFMVRLCDISWSPVPLFYVIKAFSSLDEKAEVWDESSLKIVKLFLTNALQTHSVYIRGAIQCCIIKALVNYVNTENLDIFYLTDVVGAFSQDESLKRGSDSWNLVVEWFKKIFSQEKAHNFITVSLVQLNDQSVAVSCINCKSLARMLILLFDASFILVGTEMDQIKTFLCSLHPIFKHLENVGNRLYASKTSIDCGILLLNSLIEECHSLSKNDITHRVITSGAIHFLEDLIMYIRRRLFLVTNVDDFHSNNLYLKFLFTLSNEKILLPYLLKFSDGLVGDAFYFLELQEDIVWSKYFSMKILCWMGHMLENDEFYFQSDMFLKYKSKFSSYVNIILAHGSFNKRYDSEDFGAVHTFKGQITSDYVKSQWLILYFHLKLNFQSEQKMPSVRSIDFLIEEAMESIEIGGREVLSPIMTVFKILLHEAMTHSFDLAIKFCLVCWTAIFEHRKSEFFWISMEKFIQMLFQPKIMMMSQCEQHIFKFSQEIYSHGQAVGRVFSIFINHLYNETFKGGQLIWRNYYSILVDALTYGPVLRKDQRIYKDACEYIQSFGQEYTVNLLHSCDCFSDTSVRIKGIALLLYVMKSDEFKTESLAEKITDCLWQNVMEINQAKSRYYGNSQIHRLKQRAMQSLLLLEVSLDKDRSEHLMVSLCDSLLIESHQPSVKYLQEWLLVRILIHHPILRSNMWTIFQQVGSKRSGCMGSFIAVVYHLAKSLSEVEQEQFIIECMQHILLWCTAQQFSVRLYAQIAVQKLWDLIVSRNYEQAMKKYEVAYTCLTSGIDQGSNTPKNLHKLKENFYFNVFNPVDHFSIETIYYDIPRLANVSSEEWIPVSKFESVELHSIIPLKSLDSLLREHSTGEWVVKPIDCRVTASIAGKDQNINLQKKIMPWKLNMPLLEVEFAIEDSEHTWNRNHEKGCNQEESLVVVASLIDRTPNLGGLCRTCEAFGVSEYVLGSLKYVEDRQFQNLSVSAERWIPISEVKPFMLASYLKTMKEKGYSLIGAEQTASSTSLNEFKFPKKSLLLLGNEKDGVPADLLPLLDVCVEVPQKGIIRSLNVHVTGALFVWEYLRQHSSIS